MEIREISARDLNPERFQREIVQGCRPVVIRELVVNWPVVKAGLGAPRGLKDYLATFDNGERVEIFRGEAAIHGKYYYNAGL